MWNFEQFSSLITHCCIPQVQVNKRKYSRTAHISSKFRTFESKSALVGVKGALYWSVLRKILFSWEVEGSAAQFWCFPTSTQIHQAMNSTILNSPLCMDELGFSKIVLAHTLKPLKHDFLINSQFWQKKKRRKLARRQVVVSHRFYFHNEPCPLPAGLDLLYALSLSKQKKWNNVMIIWSLVNGTLRTNIGCLLSPSNAFRIIPFSWI